MFEKVVTFLHGTLPQSATAQVHSALGLTGASLGAVNDNHWTMIAGASYAGLVWIADAIKAHASSSVSSSSSKTMAAG